MDHYNIAVARDSSGNLYSAIKYGDDDNSNDGIGGSNSACLKLTGNDYLGNNQEFENMVVGYHGISGNEPRSISFWAKPLVEGSDIFCEGPVIAWGDTIENGALWIISIDEGCVTVHVDDAHLIQSVPVVFQEDTWYHVVVVLPQNAGQLGDIQIYCAVQDSDCVQLGTSCTNEQTAIRTGNNNYLQIGKGYEVNGAGFRGYLDEIQIYRKALSDTEIAYLHRNPQFSLPIANIKEVSAGSYHSLLLENIQEGDASCQGRVYSFGENWYRAYDNGERYCGKLGLGVCPIHQVSGYCEENSVRELPCCVVGSEQGTSYLENIIAVSAGMYHSMALEKYIDGDDTYKGYVYTWGWNLSSLHRFSPYVDLPEMVNYGGRLGRYFQATEIDHNDIQYISN
jgi:alpha-tubulin suppressor-like RCC1 family protein